MIFAVNRTVRLAQQPANKAVSVAHNSFADGRAQGSHVLSSHTPQEYQSAEDNAQCELWSSKLSDSYLTLGSPSVLAVMLIVTVFTRNER
jgi:NADPH-dependent curcumin reductase CurA